MTVTLTRALTKTLIDIPVANISFVDVGPHGGAVLTVAGQRIGVVETREQVHLLMRNRGVTK